jgi:hypothetical protein
VNREQAIRKVLACLRLSKSSNPHEAASALRQARALMEKYGLTEADAHGYDIREADSSTGFRGGMVSQSLVVLSIVVADCYRCMAIINREKNHSCGKTTIRFYGAGADAQIAAYAFTVLRRQLQGAKGEHTARIRKRANRDARGEAFAIGWIRAVRSLLPEGDMPAELGLAIDQAIKFRNSELRQTTGKQIGKSGRAKEDDHYAGYAAGKNAHLNTGIGGTAQKQLECL